MPDVEVDRPERQRDERVGEVAQPAEPADRQQRLQQRPGQAEDDQQRAEVAHQQVLGHVGEDQLVVDVAERRDEARSRSASRPAAKQTMAPGRAPADPPARERQRAAARRRSRPAVSRGDLERLEDRAADMGERDHSLIVGGAYSQSIRLKKRTSAITQTRHQGERERVAESPVEARACGRSSSRRPLAMKVGTAMIAATGRDLLHDLVLVDADQRQVRLQHAGEQLALRAHLLVDPAGVVGDVAEVAAELLGNPLVGALLERLQRRRAAARRRGGTRSPRASGGRCGRSAPGCRRRRRPSRPPRCRPRSRRPPGCSRPRPCRGSPRPPTRRPSLSRSGRASRRCRAEAQLAARPVADGDHVAGAGEDVDLAEVDLLAVLVVVGGLQDDEEVVVVVLDLRPLVGAAAASSTASSCRPNSCCSCSKVPGLGLVHADPDELAGAGGGPELRGLLGRERLLVLAHAVLVVGAVDDHRAAPAPSSGPLTASCRWAQTAAQVPNDLHRCLAIPELADVESRVLPLQALCGEPAKKGFR